MKMETVILQLLILLYIKHWYIDFVNQNDAEIASKGIYGDKLGILHSAKHGILTALCVFFVTGYMYLIYAIILGVIDFVAHYHIDWVKSLVCCFANQQWALSVFLFEFTYNFFCI